MSPARLILDRAISEAEYLAQIVELAQRCGWLVAHFRPALTGKGWRTPVAADGAGFPDLVLAKEGFPLLCWEVKREGKKATANQRVWLEVLGGLVNVDARVVWPSDWETVVVPMLTEGLAGGVQ